MTPIKRSGAIKLMSRSRQTMFAFLIGWRWHGRTINIVSQRYLAFAESRTRLYISLDDNSSVTMTLHSMRAKRTIRRAASSEKSAPGRGSFATTLDLRKQFYIWVMDGRRDKGAFYPPLDCGDVLLNLHIILVLTMNETIKMSLKT